MAEDLGRLPELAGFTGFAERLQELNQELIRQRPTTLQINTGLLCDLCCKHCHLSAGPGRSEQMSRQTMEQVVAHARHHSYPGIDITGGAPELVPHLPYLIENLAPLTPRLMLRTNLTALGRPDKQHLLELFIRHKVILVASFPATNPSQLEAQRGLGAMEPALEMLRKLNMLGYGIAESGLELNLVANPAGAFLPSGQGQAEKKFKRDLARKWELEFNQLFIFANMPLGRFLHWLRQSDNLQGYMDKLAGAFNPCTLEGLMCRSLLSVNWDGYLYDCDFNLAAGLPLSGKATHVGELDRLPEGLPIAVGDHCYACTAGSGFT